MEPTVLKHFKKGDKIRVEIMGEIYDSIFLHKNGSDIFIIGIDAGEEEVKKLLKTSDEDIRNQNLDTDLDEHVILWYETDSGLETIFGDSINILYFSEQDIADDRGFYSDLYKGDYGIRPTMDNKCLARWVNNTYKLVGKEIIRKEEL